ncbi:All-trans-nonaprenyl-diphosphate synthase (geranyl-diphosphate specific) [compost metagenome]
MNGFTVIRRAEAVIDGLGAPFSMRELLGYPLRKAEAQLAKNASWPVLSLPMTVGAAYGLEEATRVELGTASLLLYGFADVTDDAQDGDLRGDWGWQRAVNAGNALAFLGSEVLAALPLAPEIRLELADSYARAGRRMTFGQEGDLLARYPHVPTVDEYLRMVAGKSGASAAFFTSCGASAAGRPAAEVEALASFGEALGVYVQILSDLADYSGEAGTDHQNQQVTLPLIVALSQASADDARLRKAIADPRRAPELAQLLRELGADAYCRMRAQIYRRKALQVLEGLDLPLSTKRDLAGFFEVLASEKTLEI